MTNRALKVFRSICFLSILAVSFLGCQHNQKLEPSNSTFFSGNKCAQCHLFPMENLRGKYGDDWHYAHFLDPRLVVSRSTMPDYRSLFSMFTITLSSKSYISPNGETVFAFEPTSPLDQWFSFDSKNLIYFFLSEAEWPTLPKGLKVFWPDIPLAEHKQDGIPVAWIGRELKGRVAPKDKITLIVPRKELKSFVNSLQASSAFDAGEWFELAGGPVGASNPSLGKEVYLKHCVVCHGENGDGRGPASLFLYPKPRDFTSGEYKFKTTRSDEPPVDADLYRTLTHGMKMTGMPAWGGLLPRDRWNVITYIKRFAIDRKTGKNLFEMKRSSHLISVKPPVSDPRGIELRVKQGRALFFSKGKCNDCHGPGKQSTDHLPHGDGPSAPVLVDDWGYPLRPTDLAGGILKRGNNPVDIYITITTGLMGTPMPTYQDVLSDKERWDLAFYVFRLAHGKDFRQ